MFLVQKHTLIFIIHYSLFIVVIAVDFELMDERFLSDGDSYGHWLFCLHIVGQKLIVENICSISTKQILNPALI